jgi:DNA-binding response OmpR family regulator
LSHDPCLLLVEPDLAVRIPLAEYLRECGYRVLEAITTDEAMMILRESGMPVALALVAVDAPGQTDGFGLAKWVRQSGLGVEIILAGSLARTAEKASDICENGPMMAKPYHHQLLLDRIKALIAARDRAKD